METRCKPKPEKPCWARLGPQDMKNEIIVWHEYQGVMAIGADALCANRFFTHWMPVPADGWVDVEHRRPGPEDGDMHGCVLARNDRRVVVTGWHQILPNRDYTAWRRTPEGPEKG